MPSVAVSLGALEEKGWFLSQEGLDSLKEQLGSDEVTLEQVIELAKDTDLRELSEKGFRKGDLTKLSQLPSTLVLQVLQIQNIAVPSIQHVEKPRLLRVVFTDGSSKKKWIGAEILGQVESINLNTPPGTKFLVTKPIDIREQLLILGPGMLTCLGGQVQEMIQAWKAGKQFIKRTKGNQTTLLEDLPPPFIPFKIKAGHTPKDKNKDANQQPVSAPRDSQIPQTIVQISENENNNKNRRSKEKEGKRKDAAPKSNKKKDDGSAKKDGKSSKKGAKSGKKVETTAKNDSGSAKKDVGSAKKDGGSAKKDGGSANTDSESAKKDGGSGKKDAKPVKKEGESTKKDSGQHDTAKNRGPQEKDNKKKPQQAPREKMKKEDTDKPNQTPTGDTNNVSKNKNKTRSPRHPTSSLPSQQQKHHSSSSSSPAATTTNEHKSSVLSASSKPFIPSSFPPPPPQQQQQPDAASTPSARGRGANRGYRGRGSRGRSRGGGTDQ